jgi:DNA-binding response OmpR family regulator
LARRSLARVRLLVVEDELEWARHVERTLRREGWVCDHAPTIAAAEAFLDDHSYGVIVLDRRLPDGDALAACARWRRRGLDSPVLMLTVLADSPEVVAGLEAGADDYLAKPVDMPVLVARVSALLRRAPAARHAVFSIGRMRIERQRRRVFLDEDLISLTTKEFAVLETLALADHGVVDRDTLLSACWDEAYAAESNVIDVHIAALRRKLHRDAIQTVRGAGYRLSDGAW